MSNNFTPGPWKAKYKEETGTEEVWSKEGLVAEAYWTRCYPDVPGARVNEESNSRLIATAPELFSCLQTLAACTCSACSDRGDPEKGEARCKVPSGDCFVHTCLSVLKNAADDIYPLTDCSLRTKHD